MADTARLAKSRTGLGRALSGSVHVTRQFLERSRWLWPIVAVLVLGLVGYSVYTSVERAMRDKLAAEIETILRADVEALKIWMKAAEGDATAVAASPVIAALASELLTAEVPDEGAQTKFLAHPAQAKLRQELTPWLKANDYNGYVLLNADGLCVASFRDDNVGVTFPVNECGNYDKVLAGRPMVTRPMKAVGMLEDHDDPARTKRTGLPTMFAAAAIRSEEHPGVLGLRIRPDVDFSRILSIARSGETGETYAFDKEGLLLSQSRFDSQLKSIGLLPDDKRTKSVLNIQIRDPGVDMTAGLRPAALRDQQPLTRMAAAAVTGQAGVDVDGYRDYRGVTVVGAWQWFDDYGFGVATEIDLKEAYAPLYVLRVAIWSLMSLITLAAVAICIGLFVMANMQRKMQKAMLEARQLGQYTLEGKLGAGGMGVVYRGRHAMLRRPTAIKLLEPDKTTPESVARFEREVQLTSQLNHPNTIAVYDFGRTAEGVFFYAMEYLDGLTLQTLVERHGPQPPGRVIHILRQMCGSLAEAHGIGLIHRDIKPANVMLNQRGGVPDVVKILDFGLVRAVDANSQARVTAAEQVTGTPLYLSPEAVQSPSQVDARSDLYAVGAVGYFLLTGTTVFDGQSLVEICMHHVRTPPEAPSARLKKPVSADLEKVLLRTLAKVVTDRPQTARELSAELERCVDASAWSMAEADRWWAHRAENRDAPTIQPAPGKVVLGGATTDHVSSGKAATPADTIVRRVE